MKNQYYNSAKWLNSIYNTTTMNEKVYINAEFKAELTNLNCGFGEDYIIITRKEGDKVFFQYGKCKLHVTKAELEEAKLKAE